MSSWRPSPIHFLAIVAATATTALFVPTARSEYVSAATNLDERLLDRLVMLENRVIVLEDRLRGLELEERSNRANVSVSRNPRPNDRLKASPCTDPRYLDDSGVWRVRSECQLSQSADTCEPPFVIEPGGIKRIKMNCL